MQPLSMLLSLSGLEHNLPYRLYDPFLQCAILLCLPNCFHLAFPQTGTKHYFQGLRLENEGWSLKEKMIKWEGFAKEVIIDLQQS